MKKDVGVSTDLVKGSPSVCLYFRFDRFLAGQLAKLQGGHWHSGLRCWVVPGTKENKEALKLLFGRLPEYHVYPVTERKTGGVGRSSWSGNLPPLDAVDKELMVQFRNWLLFRRYSHSTVRTYSEMVTVFLRFIKPQCATDLLGNGIQRFTIEFIIPRQLSYSYQNQLVNAVQLFYREMLNQQVEKGQLQRPRPVYKLPNVLSKPEVKKILGVLRNVKHRAMLSTVYGCGLRRGELLNLRPADIDSERGILVIRSGKGNKDRVVPISMKNIELLREYYKLYRPRTWLFEGVVTGERYDERSLQQVLKKAVRLANIKKPVTLHWLRHSYATHLHESGVDIRYIQEILGHRSTKTTEIYTHVSTRSIQHIRSPLDDL